MRTHQARDERQVDPLDPRTAQGPEPGKRTLTEQHQNGPEALVAQATSGPSTRLPDPLRGQLENKLKTSLGEVRIFTSSAADAAATAYGAQAFALGLDVFFASGRYQPETPEGQELIAHEVAHTVQQRGAKREGPLEVSSPGDAHEVEAEQFAQTFASGEDATPVSPVGAGTVSRAVIARQVEVLRGGAPPQVAGAPATPSVEQRLTESERRQAETERRLAANFRLDQIRTQIDAAYRGLESRLNAGFAPYRVAHQQYTAALQQYEQQRAAMAQLLLNILCVGLAGMAGGALQQVLKSSTSSLLRIAVATAGGDLAKYMVPRPDGAPAGPPEGDVDPQLWLTSMISNVQGDHASLLAAIGRLTGEVASGLVPPAGIEDPIASITSELGRLTSIAQVRPREYYSIELWRAWLDRHESTFRTRADLVRFLTVYRPLLRAIFEQCGEAGQAMVRQKMCTSASTGGGSIDMMTGRPTTTPLYGCGPTE
jgi:hypothetical protein